MNQYHIVENIADLSRSATGYDLLVLHTLLLGYTYKEVGDLLGVSKQAIHDQMRHLFRRYQEGRRPVHGRPRKPHKYDKGDTETETAG